MSRDISPVKKRIYPNVVLCILNDVNNKWSNKQLAVIIEHNKNLFL